MYATIGSSADVAVFGERRQVPAGVGYLSSQL